MTMKHFTIKELTVSATAERLGIDNTPTTEAVGNLRQLVANVLDPLREAYGHPIYVNSGYRCAALNRAVGGVPSSQHLTGEAADITAGSKRENRRLLALVKKMKLPVDQVIDEQDCTWLHISYGPRHRRSFLAIN